jgi:hypothetical protein
VQFDARAREWIEHALGPAHRVATTRRARGGVSSVVHCVVVENRGGARAPYMLRRVPLRTEVPNHDPTAEVRNESDALGTFGGDLIPELVAVDPAGDGCGVAALLSTWLPGRPEVRPRDGSAWIGELAAALDRVPTSIAELRFGEFVPWFDASPCAPEWSRVPDAWERVRACLDTRLPAGGPARFVHRDFHPGNVLLHRGRCSGIVDWTHASVGAPEVDVSRVRVQIAVLTDRAHADDFLRRTDYAATYDPLWDALVACEIGPWADDLLQYNEIGAQLTLAHIRDTFDALVKDAARHL